MEFYNSLTSLKTLDLSGNHFVVFDVSQLPQLSELKIGDSPFLNTLEYSQHHLTKFKTFSAQNSSRLSHFCPWIIWSSPLLQSLNLGMRIIICTLPILNLPIFFKMIAKNVQFTYLGIKISKKSDYFLANFLKKN